MIIGGVRKRLTHNLGKIFRAQPYSMYISTASAINVMLFDPYLIRSDNIKNLDTTTKIGKIITTSPILEKKKDNLLKRMLHSSANLLRMLWRSMILAMNFSLPLASSLIALIVCSEDTRHWWWALLRSSISSSGPCAIKLCQWAATRPDLFPLEMVNALSKLQNKAYTHTRRSAKHTIDVLKNAFGSNFQDFIDIDVYNPESVLGSGCVASVYRGKVNDKSRNQHLDSSSDKTNKTIPVAVKVIHPNIQKQIESDLRIMNAVAVGIGYIPGCDMWSLEESVQEFSDLMKGQIDLRLEANSLNRFIINFNNAKSQKNCRATLPSPLTDYLQPTENVLIETLEEGTLASDMFNQLSVSYEDRKKYSKLLLHTVFQMVFQDNFLHADMHPGNILLRGLKPNKENIQGKDGRNPDNIKYGICDGNESIVLLDAGISATLSTNDRQNFIDLFHCIVTNQGYKAGILMAERSKGGLEGSIKPEEFANKMQELVESIHKIGLSLGKVSVAELLQRVLVLCYVHSVKLDASFVRVVLGMVVVEGFGRRLDPEVNLLAEALPYILSAKKIVR